MSAHRRAYRSDCIHTLDRMSQRVDLRNSPLGLGVRVSKIGKIIGKILQIFGGIVLGCIKTKFCNKICV